MRFLFFITKPYSVPVLNPIKDYCNESSGVNTAWFKAGAAKNLKINGLTLKSDDEVFSYDPDAIIVPGNVVPHYWPGVKVQIFHGLCEEKKGHYDITGFFDLYCTPGPLITEKFQVLQKKYKSFLVKETGWPKLDNLFKKVITLKKIKSEKLKKEKKTILYAPTFSPKYKSSSSLFNAIKKTQKYKFNWLVKFHNLENESVVKKYRTLSSDYFKIIEDDNILNLMESADILITDTSSVAYEYLLFNRPIITYKAETRFEKGLNLLQSDDLIGAIVRSIEDPDEFKQSRDEILNDIHPYQDGKSSKRLVETISDFIKNKEFQNLKRKSRNWYKKMQIRKIVSS
tara:strand:- start:3768 stop:4793 length:1026 start_codon:yes stop_codon:yes gene_type:complete